MNINERGGSQDKPLPFDDLPLSGNTLFGYPIESQALQDFLEKTPSARTRLVEIRGGKIIREIDIPDSE